MPPYACLAQQFQRGLQLRGCSLSVTARGVQEKLQQQSLAGCEKSGSDWKNATRASLVEAEAYLFACYRYIELNPLRAGMVQDLVEYPWSSSCWHALDQPDPIITDHALYLALGSTPQERRTLYRALCQEHLHASGVSEGAGSALGRQHDACQRLHTHPSGNTT